jgi:hypothetical protein
MSTVEFPAFCGLGVRVYRLSPQHKEGVIMLWTISVILLSLWLLGISTPSTLHGYIHILLALAVATSILPFIRRKTQHVD